MYYESFFSLFPEVAAEETKSITVFGETSTPVPAGIYLLVESYCATPKCDCRRTFLNIFSESDPQLLAVISYGWENRRFYVKWFGIDDRETIADLKGPALASGQPQSELAPQLLKLVTTLVLSDPAYIARLRKHYQMFKSIIDKPAPRVQLPPHRKIKA